MAAETAVLHKKLAEAVRNYQLSIVRRSNSPSFAILVARQFVPCHRDMILELIALSYVTYLMFMLMLMSLCKPALNKFRRELHLLLMLFLSVLRFQLFISKR